MADPAVPPALPPADHEPADGPPATTASTPGSRRASARPAQDPPLHRDADPDGTVHILDTLPLAPGAPAPVARPRRTPESRRRLTRLAVVGGAVIALLLLALFIAIGETVTGSTARRTATPDTASPSDDGLLGVAAVALAVVVVATAVGVALALVFRGPGSRR